MGIDKLKMEEQRKIQMQMREDTNFAAQVKQLEKAGLNPALLYGKGGAGGMSVMPTGGMPSASAGAGTGTGGNYMAAGIAAYKAKAEIELMQAQARNLNIDADKKVGADTANVEANTALTNVNTEIAKIQKEIIEDTKNDQKGRIRTRVPFIKGRRIS